MKKKKENTSAYWQQVAEVFTRTGSFGNINLLSPFHIENEKRIDQYKKIKDLKTSADEQEQTYQVHRYD